MDNLIPPRAEMIEKLKSEEFDIIIVGGGVTGANVLRDATLRGLKACLIEKEDFGSGTSMHTSKLIHGGLRYLKNFEFRLVRESTLERKIYLDLAPYLADNMKFIIPIYKWNRGLESRPILLKMGLILYEILSIPRRIGKHRMLNPKKMAEVLPMVVNDQLRGGAEYYDVRSDDARLTLINALSGVASGGIAANYVEATSWEKVEDGVKVDVLDHETGEKFSIDGSALILTTGPWSEITESLGKNFKGKAKMRLTRGTHILLDRTMPEVSALLINDDSRPVFVIPRINNKILAGTTDVDFPDIPDKVVPTKDDVMYILDACNKIFPTAKFTKDDIMASFAGVRPLVYQEGVSEGKISRDHSIFVDENVITLVGGKLTTARVMAKQALDKTLKILGLSKKSFPCFTHITPLFGGDIDDWDNYRVEKRKYLMDKYKLSEPSADMILLWYGAEYEYFEKILEEVGTDYLIEGSPWLDAQVVYACRVELARTPVDFLRRRTPIMLERGNGLQILDKISMLMAKELGWDENRQNEMKTYTKDYVKTFIHVDLD